ncbi:MAG TPA: hypothetical protein VFA76_09360 [Terriglobales bacterium]|nr:hypothetical protein [Terriglobales bacterium]
MQNPWLELPSAAPYILGIDIESVSRHSEINRQTLPEPFIGNPKTARLVLLSLNPGDSDDDIKAHSDVEFRKAIISNLRQESQEYPFYGLNPKFNWTACGRWWRAHVKELIEILGSKKVAEHLLVIEWFPYHSKRWKRLPTREVCPSQNYSFQHVKEMLDKKAVIVGMRSKMYWLEVDPRVASVPFLKNPQNPCVSKKNCGEELFAQIVEALR